MTTIQEVNMAGLKRVYKIVTRGFGGEKQFRDALYRMSAMLQNIKVAPYSYMRYWSSVNRLSNLEAGGIKRLMLDILPWVSFTDKIDESFQRKFRHTWNTVWSTFATAIGLSDYDKTVISDLGLKLPIFLSAVEHDDCNAKKLTGSAENNPLISELEFVDIHTPQALYDNISDIHSLCEFYNLALGWFCSVKNERDIDELIDYLVLSDFNEFREFFASGSQIWVSNT